MTWRSLYACGNGWRGLRPGCLEMLELPSSCEWKQGYPAHCLLDGRDLGWTAAAGGASELLVADTGRSVQVTPGLGPHAFALQTCMQPAEGFSLPAGD